MILKAQAAFTSAVTGQQTKVVDGRTETIDLKTLDGGLEITGEIIPDTPLQHEMLVAVLDLKDEPTCEVNFDVEPVTEKVTFKVRFKHSKDMVAAAYARLGDRQDAENAGLPLHIHLEKKAEQAAKEKAEKEAAEAATVEEAKAAKKAK